MMKERAALRLLDALLLAYALGLMGAVAYLQLQDHPADRYKPAECHHY